MGHRKSIVKEATDTLRNFVAYGQSKHADKLQNGGKPAMNKIYSYSTMSNYTDAAVRFVKWARDSHGCKTLAQAKQYTGEYLQQRIDKRLSAWTIRRDAAALGKLFQTSTTDLGVQLPVRHRKNVTQHRTEASKGHFSEARHKDLVDFCRATGLRRHEVAQLRPEHVTQMDGRTFVWVRQGKGGRARVVEALDGSRVAEIATKAKSEGRDLIFGQSISKYAPIHEYRADFARELYRRVANPDASSLPRSEQYICRKDMRGTVFDRRAMQIVSTQLGHNRLNVVPVYLCAGSKEE